MEIVVRRLHDFPLQRLHSRGCFDAKREPVEGTRRYPSFVKYVLSVVRAMYVYM